MSVIPKKDFDTVSVNIKVHEVGKVFILDSGEKEQDLVVADQSGSG